MLLFVPYFEAYCEFIWGVWLSYLDVTLLLHPQMNVPQVGDKVITTSNPVAVRDCFLTIPQSETLTA